MDRKYKGVQEHSDRKRGKRYWAWVKVDGNLIQLGRYRFAENAAWASDYARYILFGLDYDHWGGTGRGRRPDPPNFPPLPNKNVSGPRILHVLFCKGLIGLNLMRASAAAYDAAAKDNVANGVLERLRQQKRISG